MAREEKTVEEQTKLQRHLSFADELLSLMASHPLHLAYLLFLCARIPSLLPLLATTLLSLATFPPDHLGALPPARDDGSDPLGANGLLGPILLELESGAETVEKAYEEAERVAGVARWGELEAIGRLCRALVQASLEGGGGSERKLDKEWRRTLACRLYEERWLKQGGEEAMDLLWEEQEDREKDAKPAPAVVERCNTSGRRKVEERQLSRRSSRIEDEEEWEDEYDDGGAVGRFCCLRAVRLRMRVGGVRKVSRAIKGGVNLIRSGSRRAIAGGA